MAQETEPVAAAPLQAPPDSPSSPKRRNRKKGRRGSMAAGDDDEELEATADLISLPSPVAAVSGPDVFATMETAMGDLALTQATPQQTQEEDSLLKLPIHPSSGRLPLTPPPTPEPFMVHSPEKEQSRVAPMLGLDVQLLPRVVETPTEVTVDEVEAPLMELQVKEQEQEVEAAPADMPMQVGVVDAAADMTQEGEQTAVVHEAATLSSTLADMSLGNGISQSDVTVEAEVSTLTVSDAEVGEGQRAPVVEMPTSLTADDDVSLMPAWSPEATEYIAQTTEAPSAQATAFELTTAVQPSVVETASTERLATSEPTLEETPLSAEPTPTDTPLPAKSTSADTLLSIELIPAKALATNEPPATETSEATERATQVLQQEESKDLPDSSRPVRRNKRKGDSPEHKPHTASAATPRLFPEAHQSNTVSSVSGEDAAKPTLMASKAASESQTQSRPAKRKGDTTESKPPPAPVAAVAKEIRPKRLVARSNLGSTLSKAKLDPAAKPKPVVARPVHDQKKDSMMNPTASSMARATAAEARKTLLKSSEAKKAPARKPMRTKILTKSAPSVPSAPSDQENSISAPPVPATEDDGDDSQRNVKRRLNATDAEAASKRLYEDAKGAKARKDARRVELEETYTFAPQVNNFKRRTTPGETEEQNKDHFTRLHAQAKELMEKKRELQQQHERDGCTFAPTISARAKRLAQPSSGPRYENLYKHAQELKQKREVKLMEKAKTTEEQCPFKPKITASKSPVKTKPLYDSEREKQKRLALEQKKIEAEMTECTFKPKVSAKRLKAKTEEPPDAPTDVAAESNPYNRLYQASIERAERLQKLRQERDEEEKAQAPFQPKIITRSRMSKTKAKTKEPFHKRLYNKDYMKKLDAEREQRRLEEEQQFTFKPEINEPPEEIKAKVNERASPRKSIFERLYDEKDKVKEKIEMGEELRLQKEMAECTFRPQIEVDAVQSNGEPAAPVWERLLSYDKAQVIEEREKLKEQMEMQECTFKPEVKSPDALSMKRSPSFNVFDRLTGSGANSPLDPTRASFIKRRPSSSPVRQSPDSKGVSIGRIIKLTKFSVPTARKMQNRTYSISQPSSVNKQAMKRSTSFSGPKSAASSPTMSTADVLSNLSGGSYPAEPAIAATGEPQSITENYESWSAALDAKLRHL